MVLNLALAVAGVLAGASILLLSISLGTHHWVRTTVDRPGVSASVAQDPAASSFPDLASYNSTLENNPVFYTRYRGLFYTCFDETKFLESRNDIVDNSCIKEDGYELESNQLTVNWGDDYELRKHLMRAHVAFFIIALLLLVAGAIVGAAGCWTAWPRVLVSAGILVFLGVLFGAGGMGTFHGYEYLEKEKINQPPFPKYWVDNFKPLTLFIKQSYGYSYFVGWVGVGTGLVAALTYMLSANIAEEKEYRAKRRMKRKQKQEELDYKTRQIQPAVPVTVPYNDFTASNLNLTGPYASFDPYDPYGQQAQVVPVEYGNAQYGNAQYGNAQNAYAFGY